MHDHHPARHRRDQAPVVLTETVMFADLRVEVRVTSPAPTVYRFTARGTWGNREWSVGSELTGKRRGTFILRAAARQLAEQLKAQVLADIRGDDQ
ncbi:hypothetical protein SEA_LIGMA_57 [Gordonia phage Ligma]|nr:hypothetical protein SEA_LIGMA_57 [Gordonia phage Ligma]UQT02156.1 hypothetical protein SEA_AXUMITE_57 [Gordonia phage Axumite]